jgi:uncharacterized protein with FMN-binding domain
VRRVVFAVVSTVTGLVLLLSFKTHSVATPIAAAVAPPATVSTSGSSGSSSGSSGSSSGSSSGQSDSSGDATSAPSPTSTATSSPQTATTKTVTGDAVDTRWGPVQVQITVSGGKVTAAQAIVYPLNNPRDQEINAYAVPTLNQEAVDAGSSSIDMVSGATYTSEGYIQSLQSALDKLNG